MADAPTREDLTAALRLVLDNSTNVTTAAAQTGRAYTTLPPAAKPIADFIGLIFRNFNPRRDPIPPASDQELQTLKMPIAIFLGGEDALIDSQDTKRRAEKLLPQAEIHFDPKIGHFIPTPTKEIVDFLRRAG